jgi:hypothetical protein
MGADTHLLQTILTRLTEIGDQLATLTVLVQHRDGQVADDAVTRSTKRSRLLTAEEVALELRFDREDPATGERVANLNAFYSWRCRHRTRLPAQKRGRSVLFLRSDVELCLRDEREHVKRFLRERSR